MEDLILVGYGGHAKSMADCIERQGKYRIIGYTDIKEHVSKYAYLGNDGVLKDFFKKGVKNAAICIGYLGKGRIRQNIYSELKAIGYTLPVIIDPSAVVSETAEIGEGTFVGKLAVVNTEAKIGKMAIVNTKALIEHECVVGEFTHIAVGAVLCGTVSVGSGCFVGANSTVLQNLSIGNDSIVAAGALITENIENSVIVKNKLTVIRRQKDE